MKIWPTVRQPKSILFVLNCYWIANSLEFSIINFQLMRAWCLTEERTQPNNSCVTNRWDLDIRFGLCVVQMATHITSKFIKAKRLDQNEKPWVQGSLKTWSVSLNTGIMINISFILTTFSPAINYLTTLRKRIWEQLEPSGPIEWWNVLSTFWKKMKGHLSIIEVMEISCLPNGKIILLSLLEPTSAASHH